MKKTFDMTVKKITKSDVLDDKGRKDFDTILLTGDDERKATLTAEEGYWSGLKIGSRVSVSLNDPQTTLEVSGEEDIITIAKKNVRAKKKAKA